MPVLLRTTLQKSVFLIAFCLVASITVREAFFGYTAYFVIVPGAKVSTDGKRSEGWLHRSSKGEVLILTRVISGRRESYLIRGPGEKGGWISNCGNWSAPKFPLVAIGDVNPPCIHIAGEPSTEKPSPRLPIFGLQFVEFTADDRKRIKAVW